MRHRTIVLFAALFLAVPLLAVAATAYTSEVVVEDFEDFGPYWFGLGGDVEAVDDGGNMVGRVTFTETCYGPTKHFDAADQPDYIKWRFRVDSEDTGDRDGLGLVLRGDDDITYLGYHDGWLIWGWPEEYGPHQIIEVEEGTWYDIEMVDIEWGSGRFGISVNGMLESTDLFMNEGPTSFSSVQTYGCAPEGPDDVVSLDDISYGFIDDEPPMLTGPEMVFDPPTIYVSDTSQTVTVQLTVEDDKSGFSTGTVAMSNPNAGSLGFGFTGADRVVGDALTGVYEVDVEFPPSSAPGTWTAFEVTLVDLASNSTTVPTGYHLDVVGNPDADSDGVPDSHDMCAGTTLGDPPDRLKTNRFAANELGIFADANATYSGYSIASTFGCDEDQIIELMGLGRGHERFGITLSVLLAFTSRY